MGRYEYLREVFEILEYRHGTVYKTRSLGYRWVLDTEIDNPPEGFIYAVPPTHIQQIMVERGEHTIRPILGTEAGTEERS